jgi:hypothetical protein
MSEEERAAVVRSLVALLDDWLAERRSQRERVGAER